MEMFLQGFEAAVLVEEIFVSSPKLKRDHVAL